MDDGTAELIRLTELLRIGARTTRNLQKLRPSDAERLEDIVKRAEAMANEMDVISGVDTRPKVH